MELLENDCHSLACAADSAIWAMDMGVKSRAIPALTAVCIVGGLWQVSHSKEKPPLISYPEDVYTLPEPTTTVGEVLVAVVCVAVALAAAGYGLRYALRKRSSREQAVAALAERLPDNAAEIAAIAETVSGEPCEHCEAEGKAHIELQPAQREILNAAIAHKAATWLDCAGENMPIEDEMLLKEALYRATNKRTNGCVWSEAEILEQMGICYKRLTANPVNHITRRDFPYLRDIAISELDKRISTTKTYAHVQY